MLAKVLYVVDDNVVDLCRGFARLFEQMLVVESWINSEIHSKVQVTNEAPQILSRFMENYKATVNRTTGNGLKIPKFHQLKHMPRYILKFGSPQNFSTSRCESHHIVMSKQPAKFAQKRDKCFESQVGSRIVDNIVLSQASDMLLQNAEKPIYQSSAFSGVKFSIIRLDANDTFQAVSTNKNRPGYCLPYDPLILKNFGTCLMPISLQQMVFLALLSITEFPTMNLTSSEDILTTVEVHGLIGLSSNGLMMMDLNITFHVASCFSSMPL